MKIVCDDKIPYLNGVLEPYVDEVVYLPGTKISNADLLNADALIVRTRTKCTAALLDNTPVRFIATATIGYDHIDTAYCDKHGIVWTNAPGCNSGSVKQYIAASLACLSNRKGFSLAGKTIGIVGVGNVGSKVFDVAKAFGMHVLLNDPPRAEKEGGDMFVALDELLGKSDIITLHVTLSYEGAHKTYHLLNKKILENLQEHQIIINSSRGEVVDNTALASVLKRKRIDSAVLDVWEDEPDIHRELLSLADIVTPHIAGYSRDGKANGTAMSVRSLSRYFDLPLKEWNPDIHDNPSISPDIYVTEGDDETVLKQAVLHTYPIDEDSFLLKKAPDDFEKQRGSYWNRREFHAYLVHNVEGSLEKAFSLLGFTVK